MLQPQRIPTPHPNYNDSSAFLIRELRELKQQLIEQIDALTQRIAVVEEWGDRLTSDGR